MKRTKPIRELFRIIELTSELERHNALKGWIKDWLQEVEATQSVTHRKYLSSEFEDVLKLKLVENIVLDLSEVAVSYDLDKNNINAKMMVVRRAKDD